MSEEGMRDVDEGVPLEPWIQALAEEVTFPSSETVPRDMMWARIQRQRREAGTLEGASAENARGRGWRSPWLVRATGVAAVLVGGVAVGRYLMPVTGVMTPSMVTSTSVSAHTDSIAALGIGPDALAAMPFSSEPARVAMEEHLVRTVALLTTVRDDDPAYGPGADISAWARELLGTTRMLIDEPQLGDERTRRLLQDLELVLAQIVQARGTVPETQRAPTETMRETNLLPRVRAATSAARVGGDLLIGGDL